MSHGYLPWQVLSVEPGAGFPWDANKVPAFNAGLEIKHTKDLSSSHIPSQSLEEHRDALNAFASIVVPADPGVTGDKAAGDLAVSDGKGKEPIDTFADQMIRIIRLPDHPDLFGNPGDPTVHDALSVIVELDLRAVALGEDDFKSASTLNQTTVVTDLLTLPGSPTDAELVLFAQTQLLVATVKLGYWLNYPEHRVTDEPTGLGFGSGNPVFSDAANQISNPNIVGTGTAWDYVGWWNPERKGVEDLRFSAILDLNDADFVTLRDEDLARTLINRS